MSNNPINLILRFLLEIAILFSLGYWGWTQQQGVLRYVLAIGLPIIAAVIWGTVRVPGDASHSGTARVPVPGTLRLIIRLGNLVFIYIRTNHLEYDLRCFSDRSLPCLL
jgi:hypothetical protein